MTDSFFEGTGFVIFCMLFYGFVALIFSDMTFNYSIALGFVAVVFTVEVVEGIFKLLSR